MSYLTPSELAARWHCSAAHVRRLCRAEKLAAMRLGSDWRISEAAVAAYEQAQTTREPAPKLAVQPSASPGSSVGVGGLPDGYEPVFKELWVR